MLRRGSRLNKFMCILPSGHRWIRQIFRIRQHSLVRNGMDRSTTFTTQNHILPPLHPMLVCSRSRSIYKRGRSLNVLVYTMKAAPLHESNVHSHSHYLNGIIFLCFPITESKLAHISQSLVQEKSKKMWCYFFACVTRPISKNYMALAY